MATCEHCGQTIKVAKLRTVATVNVDDMTDAQLYAHRKATAPYEDLKFWLRMATMPATLAVRFALLEPLAQQAGKRAEFYRQFKSLQDLWRIDSNDRERADLTTDTAVEEVA